MNTSNMTELASGSLQIFYSQPEHLFQFSGDLRTNNDELLDKTAQAMNDVVLNENSIILDLRNLTFLTSAGVNLFYNLVKLKAGSSTEITVITCNEPGWQSKFLRNLPILAKKSGNKFTIQYM